MAETEDLADLLARYRRVFGEPVPLWGWSGPDGQLVELLDAAIRDGRRLDEADLARAQGLKSAPPGSLL